MFENPRRGRQARNFGKNVPKILDLKPSSQQIFSENCRWVPLCKYRTPALSMEYSLFNTYFKQGCSRETRSMTDDPCFIACTMVPFVAGSVHWNHGDHVPFRKLVGKC